MGTGKHTPGREVASQSIVLRSYSALAVSEQTVLGIAASMRICCACACRFHRFQMYALTRMRSRPQLHPHLSVPFLISPDATRWLTQEERSCQIFLALWARIRKLAHIGADFRWQDTHVGPINLEQVARGIAQVELNVIAR